MVKRRLVVENTFTGEIREVDVEEDLTFGEALINLVPLDERDCFWVLDEEGTEISSVTVKNYKGVKVYITPGLHDA